MPLKTSMLGSSYTAGALAGNNFAHTLFDEDAEWCISPGEQSAAYTCPSLS